jgi:uncharacterized protein YdhG (YjbR/CyaY superfamily)
MTETKMIWRYGCVRCQIHHHEGDALYAANIPCVCWAHGNLHEDLRENVREAARVAKDEVAGIQFGFLRRMVAIDKFNAARKASALSPAERGGDAGTR